MSHQTVLIPFNSFLFPAHFIGSIKVNILEIDIEQAAIKTREETTPLELLSRRAVRTIIRNQANGFYWHDLTHTHCKGT